jgi:hypothetical protein
MGHPRRPWGAAREWLAISLFGIAVSACTESGITTTSEPTTFRFDSTRLCALVPARDPAAAAFPPTPPVKAFGTDLGWTYERDGVVTMLFGDTWQRIDICPLQLNDDTLATMAVPDDSWPGYSATGSIPDTQCPELTFPVDQAGTAFAPIELRRWDGVVIPLIPLNTPVTGFFDGQREWSIFIVAGGQRCEGIGTQCPSELSAQGADLVCGQVGAESLCVDPTSTRSGAGAQAFDLHIAERVGPTQYISRAIFLTNKYLNLTARTVRSFDPADPSRNDYSPGTGKLLVWGRPAFDNISEEGEAPPYFLYHSLPLEVSGDRLAFEPQYLSGGVDAAPTYSTDQRDAVPLYTGELDPVNHHALSWVEPLQRWVTIYSGSSTDFISTNPNAGRTQPVPGALYARVAPDPWGPWTDATPVLTNEQMALDLVCGKQAPVGCLPPPMPLIRPGCLELADPLGGGNMYGANIIDVMTREVSPENSGGRAADIYWNVSTWHPYSVILVRTHIEAE